MKSLTQTIKESILGTTNSGRVDFNKKFVEKLAKQGNNSFTTTKDGKHYDTFGHEVQVGDVVVNTGAFVTNPIQPVVITKMNFEKDMPDAIMIYNPYTKKEERTTLICVMKILEPEKYLK